MANINAALMRADLAKLPLWSGDSSKDGYTIEQWCTRVNKAATTAAWNDADTMAYVYNALRGPALRWLESLKRFNVNIDSWAAVRTEMLDAYSRVQTARTAVVNLSDLKQGQNESVTDFGARVARTVGRSGASHASSQPSSPRSGLGRCLHGSSRLGSSYGRTESYTATGSSR